MAVQSGSQVSTRLSDVPIVPEIATAAIILRSLNSNAFVNSGVMIRDPEADAFLTNNLGGKNFAPRYLGPLADDEPNISSDDPAEKSTPKKITGGKNKAVRQSLNQSWSSMDLTNTYLGLDITTAITNQIGDYWNTQENKRLLASLKGIIAADLASGSPVMTVDVTGKTGADALFNAEAFIDAQTTMGDMASSLTAVAVHSTVYATMKKLNLIDFIPASEGRVEIPTYQGLTVIQDDAMTYVPAVTGDSPSPAKYYTYLFGRGAVALGVDTDMHVLIAAAVDGIIGQVLDRVERLAAAANDCAHVAAGQVHVHAAIFTRGDLDLRLDAHVLEQAADKCADARIALRLVRCRCGSGRRTSRC